ncbi:MAG: hypothetical protein GYB64_14290 [Chloroflexi bacterium]|nr:hypothetical protein [Chloroflexota bacterium]
MERHSLFLFDVDGVLIYPKGYKEALIAAVNNVAAQMDQDPINLTYEEIAVFEACGLTNEWESLAMCAGLMLVNALQAYPDQIRNTFALTVEALQRQHITLKRPDFVGFARQVRENNAEGMHLAHTVRDMLIARSPSPVHPILHELFDDVYGIHAPMTRLFQHYTLGSERFEETYGTQSDFKVASFLLLHDIPHIQSGVLEEFLNRDFDVSIYTTRPSQPPVDLTPSARERLDTANYPPEGDLAAGLLGVLDKVPLIAGGRIMWIAAQHKRDVAEFLKPSPIQALAAIGAALSAQETAALEAAVAFYDKGEINWPLDQLRDQPTHIIVFEDSVGGIRAVQSAVDLLRKAGLDVTAQSIGVAPEQAKREALAVVADYVTDDINLALSPYLN